MEFRYDPSWKHTAARHAVSGINRFMGLMREVHPTFRAPGLGVCVTRFDDVQEVLLRSEEFSFALSGQGRRARLAPHLSSGDAGQ